MSPKVDFRLDYAMYKIMTPITEMWMQHNSWGRENVLTAEEVYESEIYICRIQVFLGLWVCLFYQKLEQTMMRVMMKVTLLT